MKETFRIATMRGVLMFVGLQVGWFACVLGGAHGWPWLGPAVVAGLVALHLAFATQAAARRRELWLIVGFGVAGTLADSLQSGLGTLAFAGSAGALAGSAGTSAGSAGTVSGAWLAPPWIAALWFHFGTVLSGPLQALRRRRLPLLAFTAVGAPLAYAGGARLGAVAFHPDLWPSVVTIALVWSTLLPLGLALAAPAASASAGLAGSGASPSVAGSATATATVTTGLVDACSLVDRKEIVPS